MTDSDSSSDFIDRYQSDDEEDNKTLQLVKLITPPKKEVMEMIVYNKETPEKETPKKETPEKETPKEDSPLPSTPSSTLSRNSIFNNGYEESYFDTYNYTKNKRGDSSSQKSSSTNSLKSKSSETDIFFYKGNACKDSDDTFFNLNKLNSLNLRCIYNNIINSNMIIFINNKKINNRKKNNLTPDCSVFAFEFITNLKKQLNVLNTNIQELENNLVDQYDSDDEVYNTIYFLDNSININTIYKKLEIKEKLLFVPYDKYNLKLTEYKLRSFCQLVEELGALKIRIKFINNKKSITSKKMSMTIDENIQGIAGQLGFEKNLDTEKNHEFNYQLNYPENNTVILNEKMIKKKIKRKQLLISEQELNSNIELQTVLSSRCRHFIESYAITFKVESIAKYEKKILAGFKSLGIKLNFDYKKIKKNIASFSIITNVMFGIPIERRNMGLNYNYNISGSNVSLDYIGFNFLMASISEDIFPTIGIYKIMEFLNNYISKVVQYENKEKANVIRRVIVKIKKHFTLDEYTEILNKYFKYNSQWVHFLNFIDILQNKALIYDQLGYLILITNKKIDVYSKFNSILNFINYHCKDYQRNYRMMLKPDNKDFSICLFEKLNKKYNILSTYNWYNFNKLIEDIKSYNVEINLNDDDVLHKIITNIKIGYKHYEFKYSFIKYFIHLLNNLKEIKKNMFYFNIYKYINYSDIYYDKLIDRQKINDTIEFIKENITNAENLYNHLIELETRENIIQYFDSKEFKCNYSYFFYKLNYILNNNYNLIEDYINAKIKSVNNSTIFNLIDYILSYDKFLNINSLPLNNIGYKLLIINLIAGFKQNELISLQKYVNKILKFIQDKLKINILIIKTSKIEEYYDNIINKELSYSDLIELIIKDLNKNYNLEIEKDFLDII